jgi:hypothetical protein
MQTEAEEVARPARRRELKAIPVAPAVIPLVHAPDDPGPEITNGKGREASEEPPADNWTRIRQLFRQ